MVTLCDNERGVGLVELMIATVMIVVVALVMTAMAPRLVQTLAQQSEQNGAKNVAEEFVSWAKINRTSLKLTIMDNLFWPNCALPYTPDMHFYPPLTESRNGIEYTRMVCIEQGNQLQLSDWYARQGPDANPAALLRVNVRVSWPQKDGKTGVIHTAALIDRPNVSSKTLTSHLTFEVCGAMPPPLWQAQTCDPAKVVSGTSILMYSDVLPHGGWTFWFYGGQATQCDANNKCTLELDVPRNDYTLRVIPPSVTAATGYYPGFVYPFVVTPGTQTVKIYLRKVTDYSSRATAEVFVSTHPLLVSQMRCAPGGAGPEYVVLNNPTQNDIPYADVSLFYGYGVGRTNLNYSVAGYNPGVVTKIPAGGFLLVGKTGSPTPDVGYATNLLTCGDGALEVDVAGVKSDLVAWGPGNTNGEGSPVVFGANAFAMRRLRRGEGPGTPQPTAATLANWSPNALTHDNATDFLIYPGPGAVPALNRVSPLAFGRTGEAASDAIVQIDDPISPIKHVHPVRTELNRGTQIVEIFPVAGNDSYDDATMKSIQHYDTVSNVSAAPYFSYTNHWHATAIDGDLQYGTGRLDPALEFTVAPARYSGGYLWTLMSSPLIGGSALLPPLPCASGSCDTDVNAANAAIPSPPDPALLNGTLADYLLTAGNPPGTLPDAKMPYIVLDSTGCYHDITGHVVDTYGHPMAGFSVRAYNASFSVVVEKLTQSPDGSFELIMPDQGLVHLAVNDYRSVYFRPDFRASDGVYGPATADLNLSCGNGSLAARTITVGPYTVQANASQLTGAVTSSGTIRGTVTGLEGGQGISTMTVLALLNDQILAVTTTDLFGNYRFSGLPLSQSIRIRMETSGHGTTLAPAAGSFVTQLTDDDPQVFNFTVAGVPGKINGTALPGTLVVASTYSWSGGMPASIQPGSNANVYMQMVGPDGLYAVHPTPGYAYNIYCVAPGYRGGPLTMLIRSPVLNAQETLSGAGYDCP